MTRTICGAGPSRGGVYVTRTPRQRTVPAAARLHLGEFDDPEAQRLAEIAAGEAS